MVLKDLFKRNKTIFKKGRVNLKQLNKMRSEEFDEEEVSGEKKISLKSILLILLFLVLSPVLFILFLILGLLIFAVIFGFIFIVLLGILLYFLFKRPKVYYLKF